MTRKRTSKIDILPVVTLLILILVLIAQAASPQTEKAGVAHRLHAKGSVSGSSQSSSTLLLPPVTYPSGGFSPNSVAVADMNSDGKPDLVVANTGSNTVGILQGNGDGTFGTAATYDSGGQIPVSVAVADLHTPPGELEVVVANGCADEKACSGSDESGVGVLFAFGNPAAVTYRSGGTVAQLVKIADVDNDGIPDLMVAHLCASPDITKCSSKTPGSVGVLLGHDDIFTLVKTYSPGGYQTASLAVADVNGDGQPDLVVANSCAKSSSCINGSVGVLLGFGDGTFKQAVTYPAGNFPLSGAVADVNGDGKPDLVVADAGSGSVGVMLGNGDGTFASIVNYASGGSDPDAVVIADLNGDGKPDLVVANAGSNTVGILLGNGDGTFQTVSTFDSGGSSPSSVAVADVNGDGKPDLVVANALSNNIGVLLNNPSSPVGHVSPSALDFGKQVVNTTSVSKRVSLFNTGDAQMTVTSFGLTGDFAIQTNHCTNGVKPGTHCDVYLTFTPTKLGARSGTLTFVDDATNSPQTAGLTGIGIARRISRTTVTTSGSPTFVGQPVTLTAKVTSKYGTIPDGELVTFYEDGGRLGTVALTGETAAYTTSPYRAQTYSMTATYAGDATFAPSTGTVLQVVNSNPTTTALSSSLNPSNHGQAVTFTATVSSAGPSPTGRVKFMDGTNGIGLAALSGGVAKLTKSTLAVGTHPITAQYLGDAASAKSTSSVLNQVVH